jgi:hypothetical protein
VDVIFDHHVDVGERVLSVLTRRRHYEEILEVLGTGAVALAVLLRFFAPARESVLSDRWAMASLCCATGLITAGNRFLHYQYRATSPRLRLVAFTLSVGGFLGLVWANRRLARHQASVRLVTEGGFCVFAFAAFVLLPTVFPGADGIVSIALWPATFVALAVLLQQYRPDRPPLS